MAQNDLVLIKSVPLEDCSFKDVFFVKEAYSRSEEETGTTKPGMTWF
jgi:hypothetical protein